MSPSGFSAQIPPVPSGSGAQRPFQEGMGKAFQPGKVKPPAEVNDSLSCPYPAGRCLPLSQAGHSLGNHPKSTAINGGLCVSGIAVSQILTTDLVRLFIGSIFSFRGCPWNHWLSFFILLFKEKKKPRVTCLSPDHWGNFRAILGLPRSSVCQ